MKALERAFVKTSAEAKVSSFINGSTVAAIVASVSFEVSKRFLV